LLSELSLTHEFLAQVSGVRRTSVTELAIQLQKGALLCALGQSQDPRYGSRTAARLRVPRDGKELYAVEFMTGQNRRLCGVFSEITQAAFGEERQPARTFPRNIYVSVDAVLF
jgi:hypothetical protein